MPRTEQLTEQSLLPTVTGHPTEQLQRHFDQAPPPLLHHYTDQRGLLGIIREKEIWATSIWNLNDSAEFQHARELGRSEHAKFFGEGVRLQSDVQTSLSKPWCFCVSLAWGREAPETALLQRFRDRILRRSATGRHLISLYYRTAPGLCRLLEGNRILIRALRVGSKPALWIASVVLAKQYEQETP